MGFQATAGRILITDPNDSNHVVFDTDERQLVFTDFVSGSIVVPQRVSSSVNSTRTTIDVNTDTVLSSINPASTVVFGALKSSYNGGFADPVGWFQLTGSYMDSRVVINATGATSGGIATPPWTAVGGHRSLTFRASGGNLIFNERTFLRCTLSLGGTTISATIESTTVDYKLFCGTFV